MSVSPEIVRSIIAAEAGIDISILNPEATLAELDIGSLDVVSILFALEDKFGIEIESEQIAPSFTIAQFTEHVMSLLAR